ncbi:MAG: efflux RND transporter permease subunit [Spirochaetia bacterium]|nr:efflux RND transporter permease subunit [Spirochaetia bacterium]
MHISELSIKRPVFITAIIILLLTVGFVALRGLGVDLFPNVSFPFVVVTTEYPGAGPSEVETLVSRVLEEEISGIPGIKSLKSISREGFSFVLIEFDLATDIKFDLQQVRDRVSTAKPKLPDDVKEPVIRSRNPDENPVLIVALGADLRDGPLFDLANETIKPQLEQVNQVSIVEILGGRKREIRAELDRAKLFDKDVSAQLVANRITAVGKNIPIGKTENAQSQTVYRTLGEFRSIEDIEKTVIRYTGNETPVTVRDVGRVFDSLEDEKSRTSIDGKKSLLLYVYRQSGANTIAVVDQVRKRIEKINASLKMEKGSPQLTVVNDRSRSIRLNVDDVEESILLGILLTILVVYLFLGSARATLVTGMALPTSLLGAFILMSFFGFTVNVMTLLALSLSVGLLIDDAIVVRENIFRHIEEGVPPKEASILGTKQVTMAVIATTLTVLAVFGPIGFLQGIVGQFFKEFGLTVCFAMAISLFDAFTIAPMLSAYFVGGVNRDAKPKNFFTRGLRGVQESSERIQKWLEVKYEKVLHWTISHPITVVLIAFGIFAGSLFLTIYVPKTFLPTADLGECVVGLDMPPGTSLEAMARVSAEVEAVIRKNPEVEVLVLTVGNSTGEANVAEFIINLVPKKKRKLTTTAFKDKLRAQLAPFTAASPKVKDFDQFGGGQRPFNLSISGNDYDELKAYSTKIMDWLKTHPGLKDVDINYRPGNPEFQVVIDKKKAQELGVASDTVGRELRAQVEGVVPAVYRESGREYDIRVRLKDEQRQLKENFASIRVPNLNNALVPLSSIANPVEASGIATINRENRGRYFLISAEIAQKGPGMGGVISDINKRLTGGMGAEYKIPQGMNYRFVGQAESFRELLVNMIIALGLGILFIYLVLASLYESFIIPLNIMLVLPLAICGSFVALFITQHSLDLFSMIGCIMLIGVATKNSILLVDRAMQLVAEGKDRRTAMIEAGKARLRPILMTSFALIAGMIPIAIGLNEASSQRVSMGIGLIGGLISSTVLSLVVIPAVFGYFDRFRIWSSAKMAKLFGVTG